MAADLGVWEPLSPGQVSALLGSLPSHVPWWIAGGYAIELFVGYELRAHGDIDVLLLRRDQHHLHDVLAGWDIQAADPPGRLRRWPAGETLPEWVHDIWCRESPDAPWRLQVMLDDTDGDLWRSRRHKLIRRPIEEIGRRTDAGWPYLAPEIQLFYKAKATAQLAKDEIDFAASAPLLDHAARQWLDDALGITIPHHHWRTST